MKNTITFDGGRTGVSSTGNVETFQFQIVSSNLDLSDQFIEEIVNNYGCGGQSFSATRRDGDGDSFIYEGTTTRYSD
jgi:hypothetical protein